MTRSAASTSSLSTEDQLAQERQAREQAEEKVASVTAELEELTQSLFEEANAMVRTEREKCAGLETRLQLMENREEEKRRRLEELEKAIYRITRVRNVLNNNSSRVSTVG
jgi:septal ring factor EnvC (AmiA/AmiB activator)